jgi:hypothetical protein
MNEEEERKKYMEQIQDVLLDLQLEGRIKIEEITEESRDDGAEVTTIRIQPVLKNQEELEEFLRRAAALGYTREPIADDTDQEAP